MANGEAPKHLQCLGRAFRFVIESHSSVTKGTMHCAGAEETKQKTLLLFRDMIF